MEAVSVALFFEYSEDQLDQCFAFAVDGLPVVRLQFTVHVPRPCGAQRFDNTGLRTAVQLAGQIAIENKEVRNKFCPTQS